MSYQQTINLLASGSPEKRSLGSYTHVRITAVNAPCEVSFDGQVWQPAAQNNSFGPLNPAASDIYFRASGGVAAVVSFTFGLTPQSGQDTAQSNAQTYALGNLGVAIGAGAAGGLPACDGDGYLQITNAMAFVVPGTNNNHRRQVITFSVSKNSPASLNLLDANGFAFMTIAAGQQIALSTDAQFTLSGAGGTAWVTVGQIFLSN